MPHFQRDRAGAIGSSDAAMSDDQFTELKALLQPGYELSTLMLADYKASHAPPPPNPSPVPAPAPHDHRAKSLFPGSTETTPAAVARDQTIDANVAGEQRQASDYAANVQAEQSTHTARDAANSPDSPTRTGHPFHTDVYKVKDEDAHNKDVKAKEAFIAKQDGPAPVEGVHDLPRYAGEAEADYKARNDANLARMKNEQSTLPAPDAPVN